MKIKKIYQQDYLEINNNNHNQLFLNKKVKLIYLEIKIIKETKNNK